MWGWQIWRRVIKRSIAVQLPDGSSLICPPWSALASALVVDGFHEYMETVFMLDLLRPDDLVVDVGANIGYYSIIAAHRGRAALRSSRRIGVEALSKPVHG